MTNWAVIVPVKALSQAKSRLDVGGSENRMLCATAFLLDTLFALERCAEVQSVLVVSPDHSLGGRIGCSVVEDRGSGIDDAVGIGRSSLIAKGHRGPVAVVLPDLPALKSADVDELLRSVPSDRCAFVADADRTGTTCVSAPSAMELATGFGAGSAGRHRSMGHAEVLLTVASLRHDVDTIEQLSRAIILGVGPDTTRLLASGRFQVGSECDSLAAQVHLQDF
ncbi:2-phospho-L-lactate guanylyltransferase [Rhodococcus sp. 27YEA15]|uniref:2-phospho-L-lactate guanylyltransferase n=1 Tax=Rhodococcus sp. 27YEA15 TaxID=3156259 RepID=UPI003C7AD9A0